MVAVVGRVDLACERAPSTEIGVLPGGSSTRKAAYSFPSYSTDPAIRGAAPPGDRMTGG
jgi:hypothetical protein